MSRRRCWTRSRGLWRPGGSQAAVPAGRPHPQRSAPRRQAHGVHPQVAAFRARRCSHFHRFRCCRVSPGGGARPTASPPASAGAGWGEAACPTTPNTGAWGSYPAGAGISPGRAWVATRTKAEDGDGGWGRLGSTGAWGSYPARAMLCPRLWQPSDRAGGRCPMTGAWGSSTAPRARSSTATPATGAWGPSFSCVPLVFAASTAWRHGSSNAVSCRSSI